MDVVPSDAGIAATVLQKCRHNRAGIAPGGLCPVGKTFFPPTPVWRAEFNRHALRTIFSLEQQEGGGDFVGRIQTAIVYLVHLKVVEYTIKAALQKRDGEKPALRVIHVLTGDGVATNLAAARRLFKAMSSTNQPVSYRLMCWPCASHQCNLVVQIAVCGKLMRDPANGHGLCGTLSRLYKYLCPAYFEEFSDSIKTYLLSDCAVTLPDKCKQEAHRQAVEGLIALYGEETLPEEVTSLWNISLDAPVHACAESDISMPVLRGRFLMVLQKQVLKVDEHPVVTRFWTFGSAVMSLLRVMLLNLPLSIFSTATTKPHKEQQVRLHRIKRYLSRPHAGEDVRIAALCLRLTRFCTSLVSKKRSGSVLVQVADGEVQRRAGEMATSLLQHLEVRRNATHVTCVQNL